ncbi:MAG: 2-hydroxychromene-2-carboxylate isomerase [Cryomorphaceae bacterium]|jgi:2-hydroxychromene-2-carboxylate isomerase
MAEPIYFYFDFSSSYSYLAQARIAEIERETGRSVQYRPFVLGAIFHKLGHSVPARFSIKMTYLDHDLQRSAQLLNIEFALPPAFPFNAMHAMRLFYAIDKLDSEKARDYASAVFDAAFAQQKDVADPSIIEKTVSGLGLDYASLSTGEQFESAKNMLKLHTQNASEANVFGAPSFVADGELFWGADRIDLLIQLNK